MKKIQFIMIGFLLVFALSGCDLLDDETKQTIEEFCLDNPNDESCIVHEDILVNDAFLELYGAYIENPDTFCELYIDKSSSDQNYCTFMKSSFLPGDLLDYDITSSNDVITSDTNDFVIVFKNVEDNKQVLVTVSFAIADTKLTFDAISYEVMLLSELFEEALVKELAWLIGEDLDKHMNDYVYFTNMFDDEPKQDTISYWHYMRINDMFYEIGSYVLNGDGSYTFSIYGVQDTVRVIDKKVTVYPVFVDYELVYSYGEEYDVYYQRVVFESLQSLMNAVSWSNKTLEEISEIYYFEDNYDLGAIMEAFDEVIDFSIEPSNENDDVFIISIHKAYEDIELTVLYTYDLSLDSRYIKLENSVITNSTSVDYEDIIYNFVYSFNRNVKTLDEMNQYFTIEMPVDLLEEYNAPHEFFGPHIIKKDYKEVDGEHFLNITLNGNDLYYNVTFVIQEDDTYKMIFTLIDEVNYRAYNRINSNTVYDFFKTVSTDVEGSCETYFSDSSLPYCIEYFTEGGAYSYESLSKQPHAKNHDDYISIIYIQSIVEGMSVYDTILIGYEELEGGSFEYSLINTPYENERISGFLQDFTVAINDSSSLESIYEEFVVSNNDTLNEFTEYIRDNNYYTTIEDSNIEYLNNYLVYNVYNSNDEFVKSMLMEFEVERVEVNGFYTHKLNVNTLFEVSLSITESEIEVYLTEIATDFSSKDYATSGFCKVTNNYFHPCIPTYSFAHIYDFDLNILKIDNVEGTNFYVIFWDLRIDSPEFLLDFKLFFYKVDGVIHMENVYSSNQWG